LLSRAALAYVVEVSGRPVDSLQTPPTSDSTEAELPTPALDVQSLALAQVRDPERYLILNEHGRGGLGRVSRAHDRELGRDVALKEVLSRNQLSEARFLREALITARLEHPGIVAVHEAGRWPDGTPFYTMKLVSGRSLRELIAERTTVDDRLGLLHHVIAVADAIAYAHGRHIVHRDLKPANVFLSAQGAKVLDLGLATVTAASALPSSRITRTGEAVGTPAYMAPEQLGGARGESAADVWSLGVTLYESLTGALPFRAPTPAALLRTITQSPPPPLDGPLRDLVRSMLAVPPAARPTMSEVARALGRITPT